MISIYHRYEHKTFLYLQFSGSKFNCRLQSFLATEQIIPSSPLPCLLQDVDYARVEYAKGGRPEKLSTILIITFEPRTKQGRKLKSQTDRQTYGKRIAPVTRVMYYLVQHKYRRL